MGGKATPGMPASGTVWLEVAPAAPAAALCVVAEPMLALAIIAVIARASLLRSASSLLVRLDILRLVSRAIPYMPMASSYACWSPPSGGGFGLLSRGGPACTRPLCVTAGVAAALRWRFREADGSFSAARSSRACCCFRSRHWSRRLLPLSPCRGGAGVRSIWRASDSARHAIFCRSRS